MHEATWLEDEENIKGYVHSSDDADANEPYDTTNESYTLNTRQKNAKEIYEVDVDNPYNIFVYTENVEKETDVNSIQIPSSRLLVPGNITNVCDDHKSCKFRMQDKLNKNGVWMY